MVVGEVGSDLPYGNLPSDLQDFTRNALGVESVPQDTNCLTLLATVGDKAEWNSRVRSARYKVIPLLNEKAVAEIPMMFQLIHQFGIEVSELVNPDSSLIVDMEQKTYNTFYVAEAIGSPYIPAQEEFVVPNGIRSVLGFGGILMSGAFFAIVLFSKTPIPRETAESFKTLAPNIKQAVLPFVGGAVFERSSIRRLKGRWSASRLSRSTGCTVKQREEVLSICGALPKPGPDPFAACDTSCPASQTFALRRDRRCRRSSSACCPR